MGCNTIAIQIVFRVNAKTFTYHRPTPLLLVKRSTNSKQSQEQTCNSTHGEEDTMAGDFIEPYFNCKGYLNLYFITIDL